MRPLRGLGEAGANGGRSHGEECQKASPCFPTKGGPYVVHTHRRHAHWIVLPLGLFIVLHFLQLVYIGCKVRQKLYYIVCWWVFNYMCMVAPHQRQQHHCLDYDTDCLPLLKIWQFMHCTKQCRNFASIFSQYRYGYQIKRQILRF